MNWRYKGESVTRQQVDLGSSGADSSVAARTHVPHFLAALGQGPRVDARSLCRNDEG